MQMKVSEANEVEGNLSGMFRHMEMRDCVGVIKSWNPCSQETGSMLFYIVNHQQCVNWRLLFLLRLLVRLPERGNFCPPAICAEQQGGSISPLCLRKCTHTVNSARILKTYSNLSKLKPGLASQQQSKNIQNLTRMLQLWQLLCQ